MASIHLSNGIFDSALLIQIRGWIERLTNVLKFNTERKPWCHTWLKRAAVESFKCQANHFHTQLNLEITCTTLLSSKNAAADTFCSRKSPGKIKNDTRNIVDTAHIQLLFCLNDCEKCETRTWVTSQIGFVLAAGRPRQNPFDLKIPNSCLLFLKSWMSALGFK